MAKMLMIDEDCLSAAKRKYAEQAEQMELLHTTLKNSVEELRKNWDSQAGKAFITKFDDSLDENMQMYVKVVQHMSDNMDLAVNRYQEVFTEAEKLKYEP